MNNKPALVINTIKPSRPRSHNSMRRSVYLALCWDRLPKDTVNQDEVIKQLLHTPFAEDANHNNEGTVC